MADKAANILGAIITVALVTTVLTRGSETARVITAFGNMFSGALRTAMGR